MSDFTREESWAQHVAPGDDACDCRMEKIKRLLEAVEALLSSPSWSKLYPMDGAMWACLMEAAASLADVKATMEEEK